MKLPFLLSLCFALSSLSWFASLAVAQDASAVFSKTPPPVSDAQDLPFDVRDKFRRSTPLSSYQNFMRYCESQRYDLAVNYLDLVGLRGDQREQMSDEEWARQFFIVLDSLLASTPALSKSVEGDYQDGLPPSMEWVADVRLSGDFVDILMKKIRMGDGMEVWLFAPVTLENLPNLYARYGQQPWEQWLDAKLGGYRLMRVELWLWSIFVIICAAMLGMSYGVAKLLRRVVRLKDAEYHQALARLIEGPLVLTVALELCRLFLLNLSLNATLMYLFQTAPLTVLAYAWLFSRVFQFLYIYNQRRLARRGRDVTAVLMRPLLTVLRISWYTATCVYVFHRAGFSISTMLAGVGIGGMAIALASQDTLKNVFGSLMILSDKPFIVGQRIKANGFDGVVEEIGIRSTKIRLLNGHQASIPNDTISRAAIENVGRRPSIRHSSALLLPLDTPAEKLEAAVAIVSGFLAEHEGLDPEFPPRVFLNDLTETGFRMKILFWYHPPEYWEYQAYCQTFNLFVAKSFAEAGIRLAAPARDVYMRGEQTPVVASTAVAE
ncbi:MAG: MscS family membrane protein [Lentimonas sp.]|jgi:MscS family membrane protein